VYDASGIHILLVEDNEVNQQVATELLESAGAAVTVANHGAEAVKLLTEGDKADSFAVVLMDLQMP
jgi:two-component system, sensor histidine kinase and response regulator